MTTTDITPKVKHIIAKQLIVDEELLTLDTTWEELEMEIVDQLRIVAAFEEEFGIEINLEDAEQIKTVGEAIAALEERNV